VPAVLSSQVHSYEIAARDFSCTDPAEFLAELEDLMRVGIALYESLQARAQEANASSVRAPSDYARKFLKTYQHLASAFEQTETLIRQAQADGVNIRDVPAFLEASLQVRSIAQFDYDRLMVAVNYDGPRRTHAQVRDALQRKLAADSR
jgi:type II secretory pathway component PulF